MPQKRTVLFFAANSNRISELRLTKEHTAIQEIFERPNLKEGYEYVSRFDVNKENFPDLLRKNDAWFFHFVGHGKKQTGSIVLTDKGENSSTRTINKKLIGSYLQECKSIKGVFFNSCYSSLLADELIKSVDYFIGVNGPIDDDVAIDYAKSFYKVFSEYNSIFFALKYFEKDLIARELDVDHYILFNHNNSNDMNPVLLQDYIEEQERLGVLEEELNILKSRLTILKDNGLSKRDELLIGHPHRKIVQWFVETREYLARQLANKSLGDFAEKNEVEILAMDFDILFDSFDTLLVNFDLNLLTSDKIDRRIKAFNNMPKHFYKKAIQKLPILVESAIFSQDEIDYFEDSVKCFTTYF